ncbi:putative L-type lectin-domain containing receptor kinase S.7 [Camellia lanceoleosa]|uniref:L-type lectin-domain containing receptor kinase S.7 n=1 Tax=Camellia lanceoleosa TaxID=1840588 RepID=A0ACC0H942_9ERIC|nr:putative L-type lectin-domain containing receptor kinase S.7 [Camellia lanceoleosa]
MHPRTLLFLSLFFFLFNSSHPPQVSSENIIFDFPSFTLRNPTLLGDAYLRNGLIGLTRDLPVPSSSSGTAIYNYPIPFFDPNSNSTVSFSTRFSFSITSLNPTSFGNGLCFFLSPENRNLGSQGRHLRLVNSSQLTKNKFVAVEFDTRLDSQFNDPNDNHVGLDIESLVSIMTADPKSIDIDLKREFNHCLN